MLGVAAAGNAASSSPPSASPTAIRVGTFAPDAPLMLGTRGDRIGFEAQLVTAAARSQGMKVRWVVQKSFAPLLPMVAASRVDMAASAISITEARRRVVRFGTPYISNDQAVIVRASSQVKSVADLAGSTVGVLGGTTSRATVAAIPGATARPFATVEEMVGAVSSGEVAAAIGDLSWASWTAGNDPALRVATRVATGQVGAWAYPRTEAGARLAGVMNRGLAATKANGTYARLLARWKVSRS